MKPVLYSAEEREFNTNGIGILSDAVSCVVKAELNGQYELTLQYPVRGLHASGLQQRNIILAAVDPVSRPQPFRIYNIHKPLGGIVTVNARHIAYDLAGVAVAPFFAVDAPAALNGLFSNAVNDCPFTFSTDKTTAAPFTVAVPSNVWPLLGGVTGSVLDVYGGEYEYDRWLVTLHRRRGADRGVSIRYGKNLTSLEQNENCANCYTGVLPYWVDKQTGEVTMLPEYTVDAEGNFGYSKILTVDMSADFEEAPTDDQLRVAARSYIKSNQIGVPLVSWKVEFVQLEQTEEYRGMALLEQVLLGDTVSVEFADMGLSAAARAVAVEFDSILDRYIFVSLGSVKANLASTIANQQKDIEITAREEAARAVKNQTSEDVFNRLTNNGKIQGIYLEDGKWYINAELVKIVNLIAETILSTDGFGCSMEILGGIFRMYQGENNLISISAEHEGYPSIRLRMLSDGKFTAGMEVGADGLQLLDMRGDIPSAKLALGLDANGYPFITCPDASGNMLTKQIVWKSNDDGSCVLAGQ